MPVRKAAVAGQFYEGSAKACLAQLQEIMPKILPAGEIAEQTIKAGIVPHAGWVFSGDVAGKVFYQIQQSQQVDTFVIFGAVHAVRTGHGLLYHQGQWETPVGLIDIDEALAVDTLAATGKWIVADVDGHDREHSIEVEVPLVQHLFPNAKIVPIMLPPMGQAAEIGKTVGQVINQSDKQVVCIASTDLTHYGPSYRYSPMGTGPEAIAWAKQSNDQYFIDLALRMEADQIVKTVSLYHNACGPGAVAATLAAATEMGATTGTLLAHTTSAEIMAEKFHRDSTDSVGYAGIVYS